MKYDRICIAKTGWSKDYQGAPVYGRHKHVQQHRDGHERFNFLPGPDGRYYLYLPPERGEHRIPEPDDRWLVLIVSAPTTNNGRTFGRLKLVGWFEDVRFTELTDRPEYANDKNFDVSSDDTRYCYTAVAQSAFLIPEEEREIGLPVEHGRKLGSASIVYVRGPHIPNEKALWKHDYATFVEEFVREKSDQSIDAAIEAEKTENRSYASSEHRRRVEKAAEEIARIHYKKDYEITDVTKLNIGYDFRLRRKDGVGADIHLEIKGTASSKPAFFISRNEMASLKSDKNFQLFLAMNVLSSEPRTEIYQPKQLSDSFKFEALSFRATRKNIIEETG